jgi:hypothetical protein
MDKFNAVLQCLPDERDRLDPARATACSITHQQVRQAGTHVASTRKPIWDFVILHPGSIG